MNEKENKKIKLSIAIITYNEEKNIRDCIESVNDIADEIIILDSYSVDKTKEIACEYPKVKFSEQKFKGHIEQKNNAIDLCSGQWVLALDGDERASIELKNEIQSILNSNPENIVGYKISRLTFHMGRFIRRCGWYPLYRYRFFKKGFGKWTGENPHDFIEINGKGGKLKGDIIHYSFKDLSHQVDTINKFSSIVSFTRYNKKTNFYILKSLFKPLFKFIEIYFYKLGFLDGYPGFVIAVSSSYSTFLKFAKIYEYDKGYIKRASNLRADYGNEIKT